MSNLTMTPATPADATASQVRMSNDTSSGAGSPTPRIVFVEDDSLQPLGGKGDGLRRLVRLGLPVPPAFVVVDAHPTRLPEGLLAAYERLGGGKVAVRSSATEEDGSHTSFAGQFQTFLNVEGFEELCTALFACAESMHGPLAEHYRKDIAGENAASMAVVVQRMVEPRAAGVLFTVEPVTGDRELVVIDAVPGLGEGLVSGHQAAEHHVVTRSGASRDFRSAPGSPVLTPSDLEQLRTQALRAEAAMGVPLDLEWAISRTGELFWLQARPITTLELPIDDLDLQNAPDDFCFCNYNIGEILPGAVTPLTRSTAFNQLDQVMRSMYERCGVPSPLVQRAPFVVSFAGHLYLSLNQMYLMAGQVISATKEDVDFSLNGRELPSVTLLPPAPLWRRVRNFLRYLSYIRSATRLRDEAVEQLASWSRSKSSDRAALLQDLQQTEALLYTALTAHLAASTRSGFFHTMLLRILSQNQRPTAAHHGQAAGLLVALDKVESADAVKQLDHLAQQLVPALLPPSPAGSDVGSRLTEMLQRPPFSHGIRDFFAAHGHRGMRELELRSLDWSEDSAPVLDLLKSLISARSTTGQSPARAPSSADASRAGFLLSRVVQLTGRSVQLREQTKSMSVKAGRLLKKICVDIASLLLSQGRLPDLDLIYFCTLDELRVLLDREKPEIIARALKRRRLHSRQVQCVLPRWSRGNPEIRLVAEALSEGGDVLEGTPVSQGMVEALVRVARTVDEAKELKSGEILVVPYTDVGWTPFFSLAAGVVTEIGSPISHGAVVAREYGLPAVAAVTDATRLLRTGDRVRLDGTRGVVVRLSSGASQ